MKKKVIFIVLFLGVILAGVSAGSYVYFQTQEWENRIYSGIKVLDRIDLSGLTKEEAKDELRETLEDELLNKTITVMVEDKEYKMTYKELEAEFDIEKTVEKAFNYGKEKSVLEKYKIKDIDNEINLDLEFKFNREKFDGFVEKMESEYYKEVIEPTIEMVKSGVFVVTEEQVGQELNGSKLKEMLISSVNGDTEETNVVLDAPVIKIEPNVREEVLRGIDTKVASAMTAYKTSGVERSFNVELATNTMNKTLLMPGERFSFNGVVGERSQERGYMVSKVIVNNKLVDGVGGGVCQVSTTLYHAVMKTGLKFFERLNHSLPSSYSELGQDATVAWGSIDYQFTNTFDYPIFIEGYTKDKEVFVNIYSNASVKQGDFVMVSEVAKVNEPTTKRTPDPEMYEGEEEVVIVGKKGYVVNVYRENVVNGKVLKREFISKDVYQTVNGEVKYGTKIREEEENDAPGETASN